MAPFATAGSGADRESRDAVPVIHRTSLPLSIDAPRGAFQAKGEQSMSHVGRHRRRGVQILNCMAITPPAWRPYAIASELV